MTSEDIKPERLDGRVTLVLRVCLAGTGRFCKFPPVSKDVCVRLLFLAILLNVMVGGCASQASHFNTDIVSSTLACKAQPFKTEAVLIQCFGSAERPIVLRDLPNVIDAYDTWDSVRLSAAKDYDNEVRPVLAKAKAEMELQLDASRGRYSQAMMGVWRPDALLMAQEANQSAHSQCDKIYKSAKTMYEKYKCDEDARWPVLVRHVPASTSALRIHYNETLAIVSGYEKAVQSTTQVASAKFNETIGPAKSAFASQAQIALQDDAAATARQRQEVANLLGLLAETALAVAGAGYGQTGHPPISTGCTTTNGITNCLSF
jgi:hypothetical protein